MPLRTAISMASSALPMRMVPRIGPLYLLVSIGFETTRNGPSERRRMPECELDASLCLSRRLPGATCSSKSPGSDDSFPDARSKLLAKSRLSIAVADVHHADAELGERVVV